MIDQTTQTNATQQQPTTSTAGSSAPVWMAAIVAVITAAGTLGGTLIPGLIDGLRSDRKIESDRIASCIQRSDAEEEKFRGLAEAFSVSIGRFELDLRNRRSNAEMLPVLEQLSDTGRRLGMHYTAAFNESVTDLVREITEQLLRSTDEPPNIDAKMSKWLSEYSRALDHFAAQRAACSSNPRALES